LQRFSKFRADFQLSPGFNWHIQAEKGAEKWVKLHIDNQA
jgi:hypothetical protein